MATLQIKVNDQSHAVDVLPDTPLLWVLRDNLGLTGTKFGCGIALCGACTVFIDDKPSRACSLPISALGKREVTTIEGVSGPEVITGPFPQLSICVDSRHHHRHNGEHKRQHQVPSHLETPPLESRKH